MAYAPATPAPDFLRIERVFALTWEVAARHFIPYAALTLAFGVGPMLLAAALLGMDPQDLGAARPEQRLVAMVLFVIGDALLWATLARLTLDDLEGRPTGLRRALAIPPGQLGPLLALTALLDCPPLALNLISGMVAHGDGRLTMLLYAGRFLVGMSLLAVFGCAIVVMMVERLSIGATLARTARLTEGSRLRIGLFFAAFFVFKVLGPYLISNWGLQGALAAAPAGWESQVRLAVGIASTVVWNGLASALGVSAALIYAELKRIHGEA